MPQPRVEFNSIIPKGGTMPQIQINPQVVRDTGKQIKDKKEQLRDVMEKAKSVMADLQQNFKGRRSDAIFQEWETIYPRIIKSFSDLEEAGNLLITAADEFENVDNAKPRSFS
jgi:WXG100 family type VII secretion target